MWWPPKTLDSGGQDERNEHRSEPGNPLTGPFYKYKPDLIRKGASHLVPRDLDVGRNTVKSGEPRSRPVLMVATWISMKSEKARAYTCRSIMQAVCCISATVMR